MVKKEPITSYKKFESLLADRGVTTYRVCTDCDISQSTIANWKAEGRDLNISTLDKLARYFKVPIEYFLKE